MDYEVPQDGSTTNHRRQRESAEPPAKVRAISPAPRIAAVAERCVWVRRCIPNYSRRAPGSNGPNAFTYRQTFRSFSSSIVGRTEMTSALIVGPSTEVGGWRGARVALIVTRRCAARSRWACARPDRAPADAN